MIVLVACNANPWVPYLCGKYGDVGFMFSPDSGWRKPYPFLPYALDNGKYSATASGEVWNEKKFMTMVERCVEAECKPMFVCVPDVIYDAAGTLREWDKWEPRLSQYGLQLAMVVQEGMTPEDVPENQVAFIGGGDEFKQRMAGEFIEKCPRVHVGRANSYIRLMAVHKLGAMSCDGSVFFRDGGYANLQPLLRYLRDRDQPDDRLLFKDQYECTSD